MSSPDAIIIGAGIIGCSIARALSLAGLKTLSVDRLPAPGYGSTSASSAIVRPFYSHATACAIAHEARFHWLNWAGFLGTEDPNGMASYTESGGFVLVMEGEEASFDANLAALNDVGIRYEMLDAGEAMKLYPGISEGGFGPPVLMTDDRFGQETGGRVAGGILIPEAGYVSDPQLAAHNLWHAATTAGASFRFNAVVASIDQNDAGVTGVTLGSGEAFEAPIVINVAGPHSSKVNALAGVTLPIETHAERHEVAYLRAPEGYVENGNGFFVDLDSGVYFRPDGNDVLVGTIDPACDPPDRCDPDDYNDQFTEKWNQQVYRAAQRFPSLGIENSARGTVGLYDVSTDWIPIYDRTELDGYFVAIGTSGNQFKNAPIAGDIMARIIEKGPDHDGQPATLFLPNVGREVDLSFYARGRTIRETSSVLA